MNVAKSSKKKIYEDEKKVVLELKKDSNGSIGDLAKKCGFSRQKVWRIVKRLEENKTIWGYGAIADSVKLNMKGYILLARLTHMPIENALEKDVVRGALDDLSEDMGVILEDVAWLHGNYDFAVTFMAEDLQHAKKFQEGFNNRFAENVTELQLLEKIVIIKSGGFENPRIQKQKKLYKL
jgi:DNA-binding Lrp family transcriptional regulator